MTRGNYLNPRQLLQYTFYDKAVEPYSLTNYNSSNRTLAYFLKLTLCDITRNAMHKELHAQRVFVHLQALNTVRLHYSNLANCTVKCIYCIGTHILSHGCKSTYKLYEHRSGPGNTPATLTKHIMEQ